jgi:hypothetical protein
MASNSKEVEPMTEVTRERVEVALARAEAALAAPWKIREIECSNPNCTREDVPDFARALLDAWEREKALYEVLMDAWDFGVGYGGDELNLLARASDAICAYEQAHPGSAS